jgi:DNA-binding NtrC family response regulator
MSSQILMLISDKSTLGILLNLMKTEGYKVVATGDRKEGRSLIEKETFDLMVITADAKWDPELALIKLARAKQPNMRIIAITDSAQSAAGVAEMGVHSTIEKPLRVDKLLAAVQKAVDFGDMPVTETVNLNLQLETVYPYENIVSESPAMKAVCDMVSRIASTDISVMISGEHGTGKDMIAQAIHLNSRRKDGDMVPIDCAASDVEQSLFGAGSAKGALAEANGNTLFLRHLAALPAAAQSRLFTVLQEHTISLPGVEVGIPLDVRIISSCESNMEQQVVKGAFRSDLYKLLRVIFIKVPPLRERPQDVMPTVRQALRRQVGKGAALPSLAVEVIEVLEKYTWPGNADEVGKVVDQLLKAARNGIVTKENLPRELRAAKNG